MTTISVAAAHTERALPMDIPPYAYRYPTSRTVQLAAVKTGLFHPDLPSLRRMDMDTNRLPDEHSRTTTSAGPEDFRRATASIFTYPHRRLNGAQITETGRELHRHYTVPLELNNTRMNWSDFLNRSPERFKIRLPEMPENKDLHYSGYAVRYIRPEITASWKYTLRQEPTVDQYAQKPIPANVFARYRDSHPQYCRNVSAEAWR